jgi:membrane protein implicated in regulation of membrane protease activity
MVLAAIGAIYLVAAIVTLVMFVAATWGGATMIDRALQLTLVGVAATGAFFLYLGVAALGFTMPSRRRYVASAASASSSNR